jgi:hypothetical protein
MTALKTTRARHVRRPLPQKRGNQFYRDRAVRIPETVCGAPVTDLDLAPRDLAAAQKAGWEICPECEKRA